MKKLRKLTIPERIIDLMADRLPRTSTEIADVLDVNVSKVNDFMRVARIPGRRQELHALDRNGKAGAARYVIGKGENAALRSAPIAERKTRVDDLTDAELDDMHRPRARWWPAVDVVVLNSINAMVRMREAA